jgi:sugar phosphate permease
MSPVSRLAQGKLHYSWVIAAIAFLALLVAAGSRSSISVMIVPVEQEFGWSRATVSAAVSVNLFLFGMMGPFAAAIIEWLGIRVTMAISLALVAAGLGLTPLMTQPWHLVLLWGVVVGCGTGMTAVVLAAIIVGRWFSERRGLVMGLLTASNATGQLIFLPPLAYIVEQAGWRAATALVVVAGAVILPLIILLMRDRPSDVGLLPFGAAPGTVPPPAAKLRNPVRATFDALWHAAQFRDFWILFGSFFVCGFSANGLIGTHLIPACLDHGIPEVMAAGLLAAMGCFDLLGTTASGWLTDRYDSRKLLFAYYLLRGLSLLYLPFALDHVSVVGLSAFAIFYGLDWIATVPPTVRLINQTVGPQYAGIAFGWLFAAHQLGAAAASLGAGLLRTELGAYAESFAIAGLFCVVAGLAVLMIGRGKREPAPAAQPAIA